MLPNRRTRSVCLLAVVALSGAGCSDHATPTAPAANRPGATFAVTAAKPRPRVPYISDLQLSTIYVPISPSDEYTPFTVTVTNPGPKDFQSIHLEGELQSQNNQPAWPATAFIASCPNPNGIVPKGDCTMSNGITPGWTLVPGPGTFTLRVLQQQSDGTVKVLDSKTVDVVFIQY